MSTNDLVPQKKLRDEGFSREELHGLREHRVRVSDGDSNTSPYAYPLEVIAPLREARRAAARAALAGTPIVSRVRAGMWAVVRDRATNRELGAIRRVRTGRGKYGVTHGYEVRRADTNAVAHIADTADDAATWLAANVPLGTPSALAVPSDPAVTALREGKHIFRYDRAGKRWVIRGKGFAAGQTVVVSHADGTMTKVVLTECTRARATEWTEVARYNREGFDRARMHVNGTRFDDDGFDSYGFDRHGLNRDGQFRYDPLRPLLPADAARELRRQVDALRDMPLGLAAPAVEGLWREAASAAGIKVGEVVA